MSGMRIKRSRSVGTAVAVIIVAGAGLYALARVYGHFVAGLCGVVRQPDIPSPDGRRALVAFEVDCGATTPFSTHVSLMPSGRDFSRDRYPPFFVVQGRHDLAVGWKSDGEIEIVVPQNEQVYRQELRVNGVVITYKAAAN